MTGATFLGELDAGKPSGKGWQRVFLATERKPQTFADHDFLLSRLCVTFPL